MVQAANQANASLSSISKKAGETASVLLSLKRAANTFGSFYLVKEGIGSLLEAQKQLQSIHYTLIAATGSSAQAAGAFEFVTAQSAKLGLVLPDAAQGFANLSASATAAGVSMKDQQALFDAYAKSATSLHLSTTQSSRALLALEQMFAKGKIQAQELRLQLGQAIPGAAQRFQNAVLEMTKGTDLAGKSFDQLLAAGDLTTSKFLPALVSALQESGRGWEEASQGLNANLNRVQTAWFNLKTEVSGGLFNDVATTSAGLLADNLARIAGLVTLIGAGGLAKISGGALSSGANRVTRLQQEYQGARMAAAAEVKHAAAIEATAAANLQRAEAAALENQVVKDAAASALADAKAREIEAFGIKEAALAEMQRVEAAAALNESMAGGAVAKRTSAQLDVRLAATSKALRTAEAQLTASLVTQAAARDTLALAEGRQAALRGGVLEASAAATAAAATAAKVRAAEVALGGFAAAAGRAAKSFGTFALSLVGGPWGAAIAAVGALGYAIYSANKRWDEYLAKADEVAKSNEEVTQTLKDMTAAYNDVATRPDAGALSAGLESAGKAAADARKELDDLIAKRAELQDQRDRTTARGGPGFLVDPKIGELDAKIAHAQSTMDDLTAAASRTQMELAAELAPAIRNSAGPALDFLATKVYGARDSLAALHNLASLPSMFADFIPQAIEASKALEAYTKETDASTAAALKSIQGHGKSSEGLAQVRYELLKNSAAYKNMTDDQKAAAKSAYETDAALGRGLDALAAKHKAARTAVDAEGEAYKSLIAQINSRITQDKEAAEATSTLTEAQKLQIRVQEQFRAGSTKLTLSHQEAAKQLLAKAVAQSLVTRATLQQRDADKALLDLDRQLAEQAEQQARTNARAIEGIGHGSQWNEQRAGIESIQDAYRKQRQEADKAYESAKLQQGASVILDNEHAAALGKITAAEQEAILAQQKFYDDQKAAQADWGAGFQAGIEDFMTQQQNNAAQAKQMVGDLTSGFTSAFTAFVSGTESAKDAFGSWIDDMYKRALAFVANKAIQALFDSFGASGSSATAGSSAGGWASLAGNLANAFFGSGSGSSAGASNLGGLSSSYSSDLASVGGGSYGWLGSGGSFAAGGTAHAGGSYRVTENGPEMLSIGAKNYLLMGDKSGKVTPMREGSSRGVVNITNITVQPTTTRRTADQIATANARAQRVASSRSA
jgi:lambda family phage tail tape measure protein